MTDLILFTDGSVNPQLKIGYGACLFVTREELALPPVAANVRVKRFDKTSSTRLELQTLLWALGRIQPKGQRVRVMTDSQNIIGLPGRQDRLEKNAYQTKKNRPIKNGLLYQEFFRIIQRLDCDFVKIKGHKAFRHKDGIDLFFALVDRAARHALRKEFP